jgi:UDP-N-acetylglucosamine acyltransferase
LAAVHPTAVVEEGSHLADTATVGPYCIIGAGVRLDDGVQLHSHVTVGGLTVIEAGTQIFPFATVGLAPQDRGYHGEPSRVRIGKNCTIREYATVHKGTEAGGLLTKIGDNCLLMVGAHVAHDCRVGDNVTLVNAATLGGHCQIGDYVTVGGLSAVHQYVRIGENAFVGGMSGVENDIIPFGIAIGNRASLGGLNIVGLNRRGFSHEAIHTLRRAYRMLFAPEGTLKERLTDVEEEFSGDDNVRKVVEFIRNGAERSICTPRNRGGDL